MGDKWVTDVFSIQMGDEMGDRMGDKNRLFSLFLLTFKITLLTTFNLLGITNATSTQ